MRRFGVCIRNSLKIKAATPEGVARMAVRTENLIVRCAVYDRPRRRRLKAAAMPQNTVTAKGITGTALAKALGPLRVYGWQEWYITLSWLGI